MMFFVSRFIVEIIAPFNLSILFSAISIILLSIRRCKSGVSCLLLALCLQVFYGYGFLTKDYILSKESRYPTLTGSGLQEIQNMPIEYIVILGSGHVSDSRLPANSQIGSASLYRLVEGVRLHKYWPEAKLILTGGVGYDPVPNAAVVGTVAEILGLPKEKMIIEDRPRDTGQEAEMVAPLLRNSRFLLVTSAFHMPRAMQIFQDNGLYPVAAPTDFILKEERMKSSGSYLPSPANMELSRKIIYEWIAEKWMYIKKNL